MSTTEIVTLEIAKLARQMGFNHNCTYKYGRHKTGKRMVLVKDQGYALENLDQDAEIVQAPSIHQLQTWLRDDLKIMVWCEPVGKDNADFVVWDWRIFNNQNNLSISGQKDESGSYEKALKEGLKKSLEFEKI
jgi:hypothetical protein